MLYLDHVANRDDREVGAVRFAARRVDAARARRSPAPAQQIRADHKKPFGVNPFAGPHQHVPPAGIVLLVVAGNVRIAADGMADQNRIVAGRIELAVGLVGHRHARQMSSLFQAQRSLQFKALRVAQRLGAAHTVGAFKEGLAHCVQLWGSSSNPPVVQELHVPVCCEASSACSRSALISSMSSSPIDRRT